VIDPETACVGKMYWDIFLDSFIQKQDFSTDKHLKSVEGTPVTRAQVENAVKGVAYILRGFIKERVNPSVADSLLQKHTDLTESSRETFVKAWQNRTKEGELIRLGTEVSSSFSLPRLVSLDWKLGVGVSSSQCKTLQAPFVALNLKTADSNGKVTSHPMELSLKQFEEFKKTFRDVYQQLDLT